MTKTDKWDKWLKWYLIFLMGVALAGFYMATIDAINTGTQTTNKALAQVAEVADKYESSWTEIQPGECGAFEHELGRHPYYVQAWVDLGLRVQIYASHADYPELTLFTGEKSVILCNDLLESVIIKVVAQ